MKNSAGRGGCHPPRLKAEVDNILRDLQNSSNHTKVEFNRVLKSDFTKNNYLKLWNYYKLKYSESTR